MPPKMNKFPEKIFLRGVLMNQYEFLEKKLKEAVESEDYDSIQKARQEINDFVEADFEEEFE